MLLKNTFSVSSVFNAILKHKTQIFLLMCGAVLADGLLNAMKWFTYLKFGNYSSLQLLTCGGIAFIAYIMIVAAITFMVANMYNYKSLFDFSFNSYIIFLKNFFINIVTLIIPIGILGLILTPFFASSFSVVIKGLIGGLVSIGIFRYLMPYQFIVFMQTEKDILFVPAYKKSFNLLQGNMLKFIFTGILFTIPLKAFTYLIQVALSFFIPMHYFIPNIFTQVIIGVIIGYPIYKQLATEVTTIQLEE